jgi:hypothetical protein
LIAVLKSTNISTISSQRPKINSEAIPFPQSAPPIFISYVSTSSLKMPVKQTKNAHKRAYTISKLFISDYDKFQQGLRQVFGVGPNQETTWGFREDELEVTIVALAPGPDDLLKQLQEFGYAEKQAMEQKVSGSMKQYYRKRAQA